MGVTATCRHCKPLFLVTVSRASPYLLAVWENTMWQKPAEALAEGLAEAIVSVTRRYNDFRNPICSGYPHPKPTV